MAWRGGIVKRVEPAYPPEARRKRLQGRISVGVLIDGEGRVQEACGDGDRMLRDAAESAARQGHGSFVFFKSDGSECYVIMQAEGTDKYGIYTIKGY